MPVAHLISVNIEDSDAQKIEEQWAPQPGSASWVRQRAEMTRQLRVWLADTLYVELRDTVARAQLMLAAAEKDWVTHCSQLLVLNIEKDKDAKTCGHAYVNTLIPPMPPAPPRPSIDAVLTTWRRLFDKHSILCQNLQQLPPLLEHLYTYRNKSQRTEDLHRGLHWEELKRSEHYHKKAETEVAECERLLRMLSTLEREYLAQAAA